MYGITSFKWTAKVAPEAKLRIEDAMKELNDIPIELAGNVQANIRHSGNADTSIKHPYFQIWLTALNESYTKRVIN